MRRKKSFGLRSPLYEGLLSESPGRLSFSTELCECYYQLIEAIAPAPEAQVLYRKMVVRAEAACQPFFAPNRLTTRPADQAHREATGAGAHRGSLFDAPASVGRDHQLVIRIGRAMIELEPGSAAGWVTLAEGHYLAGDYDCGRSGVRQSSGAESQA